MRALVLCSIVIAGCSSTPVELPEWDLEYAETEISGPVSLPDRPAVASSTELDVTYDAQGFDQLIAYMDVSDANYDLAVALVRALEAQTRAYNHLIDAGQMQRQIAQIRQELLDQSRSDHRIDNFMHRGVILLGLIAVAL